LAVTCSIIAVNQGGYAGMNLPAAAMKNPGKKMKNLPGNSYCDLIGKNK
jgi:hypothetical protein